MEIEAYIPDSNFMNADFTYVSQTDDSTKNVLDMSEISNCKIIKRFVSPDKQYSRVFDEDEKYYYNTKTKLIYRICDSVGNTPFLVSDPKIYPLGWDIEFY